VIEVGGLQVKPTPSPLPENLKTFLDGAQNGAILFSFGSNVKSNFLSDETIKTLLSVFSKVKQRVVMKWESDELKGKPDNVLISKWLPQDDVLAHKNVKAFISHCGYGGVIEAKFHAVPIIGVPIFGDQPGNADAVVKDGWGIKIDLKDLTEELLLNAIKEITSNSSYSKNVKKLSELSKDRPQSPQDTAIFWIEYVLRHHGAPHMHYAAADLNFLQDNSIDLIAFLIAFLYVVYRIIKFILKRIFKLCCKRGGKLKTK
jgi:glucuronosyltransferase